MKCKIDGRKPVSEDGLCEDHLVARKRIQEAFEAWKNAFGIEWKAYLRRLQDTPGCGEWAKEVAEMLLKEASEDE